MVAVMSPGLQGGSEQPAIRGGLGYWMHGYARMTVWEFANLRLHLPVLASVLTLQGAGFILGIGLFFRHIPLAAATFVTTGVPVINLITVGLIFGPQVVAAQRSQGTYEFLRSMPVPRSMSFLAWYTISLVVSLPSVVVSLAVGVARYHFHLLIAPDIIPAVVVTSLTGTLLGYAVAHAIAEPMVTRLVSVSIIFVIFGFSPVAFPSAQLPMWLQEINQWLPFESMATVTRSALVTGASADPGRAYAVVVVWGVASAAVAAWAVGHRS